MDAAHPLDSMDTPRPVAGADDLRDRVLRLLGGQRCLEDPGKIAVQFVGDEGGTVIDARIIDGIAHGLCDGPARRVIYDTASHPARDADIPIQMVMNWLLTITPPAAR